MIFEIAKTKYYRSQSCFTQVTCCLHQTWIHILVDLLLLFQLQADEKTLVAHGVTKACGRGGSSAAWQLSNGQFLELVFLLKKTKQNKPEYSQKVIWEMPKLCCFFLNRMPFQHGTALPGMLSLLYFYMHINIYYLELLLSHTVY